MRAPPSSVLIVAPEALGPRATGSAWRAAKLAAAVGRHCPVTLIGPAPSAFPPGPFRTVEIGPADRRRLPALLSEHDVAVVQALASPRHFLASVRHSRHLVVDLVAPLAFEAAHAPRLTPRQRQAWAQVRVRQLVDNLLVADLVLCTNERQRDLFLGVAMAAGSGLPEVDRFAVVPYGIDEEPPRPTSRPLRDAGIVGEDDRLAIWGGGLWGWLDPLTPIRAIERVRERRPELRLAMVGTGRGSGPGTGAGAGEDAIAYARDRGLEGDAVVFAHGWFERAVYFDHLLEADVGISAHPDTLEARYSSRARVVDYLSAGLPVACTRGDAMADFVESNRLGATAAPGDVDGFCDALDAALSGGRRVAGERDLLEPLFWRNVVRPLVEYCLDPGALPRRRRAYGTPRKLALYGSLLRALYRDAGAGEVARVAARRLR